MQESHGWHSRARGSRGHGHGRAARSGPGPGRRHSASAVPGQAPPRSARDPCVRRAGRRGGGTHPGARRRRTRIRSAVRRPGGPVRCARRRPRPPGRRRHDQAGSTSGGPSSRPISVPSPTAATTGAASPGGSRTRRLSPPGGPARPAGRGGPRSPRRPPAGAAGQDEEVHRPAGEERAGDRQALVRGGRGDHHQPGRLDAAGNGLHRVERVGEVQQATIAPPACALGREAERDRGPPARQVPAQGQAHPAGQAARPGEDPVQVREARGEDAGPIRLRRRDLVRGRIRCGAARSRGPRPPPRRRAVRPLPTRSQGRKGRRHVRERVVIGAIIEHLFE